MNTSTGTRLKSFSLGMLIIAAGVLLAVMPHIYSTVLSSFVVETVDDVAKIHRDIQYCNTTDTSQSLDLFLPANNTTTTSPLLIYVHGGGWNEGDKDNLIEQEYSVELAKKGVAVASVDYRLTNEATYPAQIEDVSCAAQYMMQHAHEYNIDTKRLAIMGDSAGGHLAAMESLSGKRAYDGVVMAYGVSNLWKQITQYHDKNALQLLGSKRQELADQASPQFVKLAEKPDFLLIHGDADTIVPLDESVDFADRLKKAGVVVSYIPIVGAGHGFLGTNDAHDKKAKTEILTFIDKTINR